MLIVLDWAGLNVAPTDAHPSALHSKICPVTYLVPELIIELTFYKCLLQKEVTGPLTMPNANFSALLYSEGRSTRRAADPCNQCKVSFIDAQLQKDT